MFGKKEEQEVLPDIKITKIPDDFYAGKNPVIKFKDVEKIVDLEPRSVLATSDKKTLDKQTMVGANNNLHPINLFANGKFLLISSLVIVFIGGAAGGIYYWWQIKKSTTVANVSKPIINNIQEPIVAPVEQIAPPTQTPVLPIETNTVYPQLDFPSILVGISQDMDKDEVSDVAEDVFKTDPAVFDTDNDKFPDGHEIFYLYNPSGKEPMKIMDSGLVLKYTNPAFSYQVYYPKDWAVGVVDTSYKQILFSTLNGENVEVSVVDLPAGDTFDSWFGKVAKSEKLENYVPFESVYKIKGIVRNDNLVYFFVKDNKVYSIILRPTNTNVLDYKIVVKMMARSFQFGNSSDVPVRAVEENMSNQINTTTSL